MKTMIYRILSASIILILFQGILYSQKIQEKQNQTLSLQSGRQAIDFSNNLTIGSSDKNPNQIKAYTSLLTQDFTSTTFPPAGWTSSVLSGTLNWSRGTGAQTYASFSTTGTTAATGYAFVNSDGNAGAGGAENCVLTSPAINCTGINYVFLKFNEFFYQWLLGTGNVEVSNNGSTWTVVHSAHTGLPQNGTTPNPWKQDINISSVAANQPTVYVRFHWTGSYDYYWFIDDIEVYSRPQFDAAFSSRTNMNEYSLIPWKQYSPSSLPQSAYAFNAGGATITNVYMTNTVYDGNNMTVLQAGSSGYAASIASNATSLLTASSYTPAAGNGFYISENIIHMTEADADLTNDTITHAFLVNDTLFARDDALFTGFLDGSLGSISSEIILGNTFTIANADALTHVRAWVTGPVVGNQTQIVVYNMANNAPTTLLASSSVYTFTVAGGQWIDLPMSTGAITLNPGTYFFGVRQISTTVNLGIAYTENNYTPLTTFGKIGTDPWDTLSNLGYNVSFIIHPILACGAYHPVITASYSHICTGNNVVLTSSPGSSYLWSPGGQNTVSITVNTPATYTVQTTSTIGCTALSSPLVLNEYPKPTVNLGTDVTACDQAQLDAGAGFVSYLWTGGGNLQYLTVTATGNYTVTVSDAYCSNSDDIYVTINDSPVPVISGGGSYCFDDFTDLYAGPGYDSYTWSVGTSTTEWLTVDTALVGPGTTTIYVTVTLNGCSGTDTVDVEFHSCVSAPENFNKSEMCVFPNPNDGDFTLLTEGITGELNLNMTNNLGEVIFNQKFENYSQSSVQLNYKGISKGVYYVRAYNDTLSRILKFVVE